MRWSSAYIRILSAALKQSLLHRIFLAYGEPSRTHALWKRSRYRPRGRKRHLALLLAKISTTKNFRLNVRLAAGFHVSCELNGISTLLRRIYTMSKWKFFLRESDQQICWHCMAMLCWWAVKQLLTQQLWLLHILCTNITTRIWPKLRPRFYRVV